MSPGRAVRAARDRAAARERDRWCPDDRLLAGRTPSGNHGKLSGRRTSVGSRRRPRCVRRYGRCRGRWNDVPSTRRRRRKHRVRSGWLTRHEAAPRRRRCTRRHLVRRIVAVLLRGLDRSAYPRLPVLYLVRLLVCRILAVCRGCGYERAGDRSGHDTLGAAVTGVALGGSRRWRRTGSLLRARRLRCRIVLEHVLPHDGLRICGVDRSLRCAQRHYRRSRDQLGVRCGDRLILSTDRCRVPCIHCGRTRFVGVRSTGGVCANAPARSEIGDPALGRVAEATSCPIVVGRHGATISRCPPSPEKPSRRRRLVGD